MAFSGDTENDKVLHLKRPVTVFFMDFTDQIQEWIGCIRVGYLRHESDILSEHAIMNALYCNDCAPMRKDCAKMHKRPEGPMDHFMSEMFTIEDADKGLATYNAAMENYMRQEEMQARQARVE